MILYNKFQIYVWNVIKNVISNIKNRKRWRVRHENSNLLIVSKHESLARTVWLSRSIISCLVAPSFSLIDDVFRMSSINLKHVQRQQVCICFQRFDIPQLLKLHRCYSSINLHIKSDGKQRSTRELIDIIMMSSSIIAILFLMFLLAIRLSMRRWLVIVTLVPYTTHLCWRYSYYCYIASSFDGSFSS